MAKTVTVTMYRHIVRKNTVMYTERGTVTVNSIVVQRSFFPGRLPDEIQVTVTLPEASNG